MTKDPGSQRPQAPVESRTTVPMSGEEMARYTGTYFHVPARIEIVVRAGQLFWKQGDGDASEFPARKVGPSDFELLTPGPPQPFQFVPAPEGRAAFILALHAFGRVKE